MNGLKILLFITVSCLFASSLYADIYKWTDESGVQHFTNFAPPRNAGVWIKTKEVPYDVAADNARIETERRERLELERLEIAQRKAELEQREAEAERILAKADRQAEETLLEFEEFLDEARRDRYAYLNYGFYGYYSGYNRHPYYARRYYRKKTGSINFKKHPHVKHYKYGHYKKRYYGHHKKDDRYKYHQKKHLYIKAHQPKNYMTSRGTNNRGALRIGSPARGHQGQRNFSRARFSLRRP
jgi:hypothetical protein